MSMESVSREFVLDPEVGLAIRNGNGSVLVRGGCQAGCVTARRKPGPELPHTRFFEPEIEQGSPVVIRCLYSCSKVAASVDLEVEIPGAPSTLEVETVNGNIILVGPSCPVVARAYNGFVRIEGPAGTASLQTRNGAVEVLGDCRIGSITTLNGDIRAMVSAIATEGGSFETVIGSITLSIPQDLGAELDAAAGRGGVSVSGVEVGSPEVGSGSMRGILGAGGPRLLVRTRVGNISISRANGR